jgi:hypothetical protein
MFCDEGIKLGMHMEKLFLRAGHGARKKSEGEFADGMKVKVSGNIPQRDL